MIKTEAEINNAKIRVQKDAGRVIGERLGIPELLGTLAENMKNGVVSQRLTSEFPRVDINDPTMPGACEFSLQSEACGFTQEVWEYRDTEGYGGYSGRVPVRPVGHYTPHDKGELIVTVAVEGEKACSIRVKSRGDFRPGKKIDPFDDPYIPPDEQRVLTFSGEINLSDARSGIEAALKTLVGNAHRKGSIFLKEGALEQFGTLPGRPSGTLEISGTIKPWEPELGKPYTPDQYMPSILNSS